MPIYEYACDACGHEFETLQKMSEEPLKECPKCHEPKLRRLVSAAGFQLKGSGWYVTDFRDKGGRKGPADRSEKAPKPEKKEGKDTGGTKGTPSSGAGSGSGG